MKGLFQQLRPGEAWFLQFLRELHDDSECPMILPKNRSTCGRYQERTNQACWPKRTRLTFRRRKSLESGTRRQSSPWLGLCNLWCAWCIDDWIPQVHYRKFKYGSIDLIRCIIVVVQKSPAGSTGTLEDIPSAIARIPVYKCLWLGHVYPMAPWCDGIIRSCSPRAIIHDLSEKEKTKRRF